MMTEKADIEGAVVAEIAVDSLPVVAAEATVEFAAAVHTAPLIYNLSIFELFLNPVLRLYLTALLLWLML